MVGGTRHVAGMQTIGSGPDAEVGTHPAVRIAMLAPPWIPVPAPAYGGIEEVVRLLVRRRSSHARPRRDAVRPARLGVARRGRRAARGDPPRRDPEGPARGRPRGARLRAIIEAAADAASPSTCVHDHVGHAALAMADRIAAPLVHTLHGPFTEDDVSRFYAEHGAQGDDRGHLAVPARRRARGDGRRRVVHNPIDAREWPFTRREAGLRCSGSGACRPTRARTARSPPRARPGVPLVLAGPDPARPGGVLRRGGRAAHRRRRRSSYVGEADATRKRELYAHARALLMPIRWREPFGLVMVEALACGTPVIAFPEGSAPEVVEDGETGFLVDDEHEMARAVERLDEIDPAACRGVVRATLRRPRSRARLRGGLSCCDRRA